MSINITTSSRAVLVRVKRGKRVVQQFPLKKLGSDLVLVRQLVRA